jgi:hypothetical protein
VKGHWERKPGAGTKPKEPRPPRQKLPKVKRHKRRDYAHESRSATYLMGAANMLSLGEPDVSVEQFLKQSSGLNVSVRRGKDWVEFGFPADSKPTEQPVVAPVKVAPRKKATPITPKLAKKLRVKGKPRRRMPFPEFLDKLEKAIDRVPLLTKEEREARESGPVGPAKKTRKVKP